MTSRATSRRPLVSFVIPVAPGRPVPALAAIAALDYPRDCVEILVARGRNPSAQRNAGIERARGDVIYLVDDDTVLEPSVLRRVVQVLYDDDADEKGGVGGPILTNDSDNAFQQAVGRALASPFGLGRHCNRYRVHGRARETDERELSSANLAVRREVFATAGNFDTRMFGNEENEWLNRARDAGFHFYYQPEIRCRRSQRKSLWGVCRQHFHYGRGRGRHLRIHRGARHWSLLAPVGAAVSIPLGVFPPWGILPAGIYAVSVVIASLAAAHGDAAMAGRLCTVFPALHLPYGAGVLWGLLDWSWRRRRVIDHGAVDIEADVSTVAAMR